MDIISLTCPSCGASLQLQNNQKFVFCSYCGQKLLVDDGEVYINVKQTIDINEHRVITDVAAIKRAEAKLKRAEAAAKEAEEETKQKKIAAFLTLILFALLFLSIRYF